MAEEYSFSVQVKEELAHIFPPEECCRHAELAGLMRSCGSISIVGAGRLASTLSTDHAPVARKMIRFVKGDFQVRTEVRVMRRRRLRKNLAYKVRIPPQPGLAELLKATGVTDAHGRLQEWGDLPCLDFDHCRRSYLRGAFLGSGWISSPERQHHLELTATGMEAADQMGQLLFGYGIPVRMSSRRDLLVLYIKGGDQITKFLGLVGAHQSLLHYENVRALKEMKNQVNRQVNAETANLSKTVEAAARQIEALRRLQAQGGLEHLPRKLRELAVLRLNHPDATLRELGEMCNPPVGKSGVNHRMRKLMKVAAENTLS